MPKSELVDAIANESRLLILKSIYKEPRYIAQIVEDTKLSRPAVCFHLNILERAKIVESEYKVLQPPHSPSGKAARFYTVNMTRLNEATKQMDTLLQPIEQ